MPPCARVIVAALLSAASLSAQSPRTLTGVVVDSSAGVGIAAVEVSVDGGAVRGVTDAVGHFLVTGSLPVRGTLQLRRLGYQQRTIPLVFADTVLRLELVAAQQRLAPVVVSADRARYTGRLAGYYERLARHTNGQFITRDDLERERPPQLSDMLRRVAGVQMGRTRRSAIGSVRMRGRDCAPLIWLDGAAMSSGDTDIDAFSPETIEGIELYLGAMNAPQRFQTARGRSECGTIVLWSRSTDPEPMRLGGTLAVADLEALIASHLVYSAEEVDLPAALDSAGMPPVEYPSVLRASGTGGLVLAEFVVDARGRAESENFNIVSSTSPLLEQAVRAAVRGATFRPASRAGQAVRQVVRQPFEFRPQPPR